eukprot:902625-Rhodomonas_salina.2
MPRMCHATELAPMRHAVLSQRFAGSQGRDAGHPRAGCQGEPLAHTAHSMHACRAIPVSCRRALCSYRTSYHGGAEYACDKCARNIAG